MSKLWLNLALIAAVACVNGCKAPECPPLAKPWKGFEKSSGFDVDTCAKDNTFAKHGHYTARFHKTKQKAMEGLYNEDVRVGLWHAWKRSGSYDLAVCYDDKGVELWRESDEAKAKARACP